jgi:hypothetical protein
VVVAERPTPQELVVLVQRIKVSQVEQVPPAEGSLRVVVAERQRLGSHPSTMVMVGRVERAYRRQLQGRRWVVRAVAVAVSSQLVTAAPQPMGERLVFGLVPLLTRKPTKAAVAAVAAQISLAVARQADRAL